MWYKYFSYEYTYPVPLCHIYPFKCMHSLETEAKGTSRFPEGIINSLVFYLYFEVWR